MGAIQRGLLVAGRSVVERDGQALVLDLAPPPRLRRQLTQRLTPAVCRGLELEAVHSDVGGAGDGDHSPRVFSYATRDEGEQAVPLGDSLELRPRAGRHGRFLGRRDDGRDRAVDVQHDRRLLRGLGQQGNGVHESSKAYDARTCAWHVPGTSWIGYERAAVGCAPWA